MTEKPFSNTRQALVPALSVAVLLTATLFLFAPASIYVGNSEEFSYGLADLLGSYGPVAAVTFAVVFLLPVLTRGPARSMILSGLWALAALLYVQGNLLVWKYGSFDGRDIPWSQYTPQAILEIVVWVGLFFVAFKWSRKLASNVVSLSAILLVVQGASLVVNTAGADDLWMRESADQPKSSVFGYSATTNVIFIVLDAFQSPTFSELLEEHPEYREQLQGFTSFNENTGVLSSTAMSIPAMLSGEMYYNQVERTRFLDTALTERSLPEFLATRGYRSNLVTLRQYCGFFELASCQRIGDFDDVDSKQTESVRLYDLALFRYSPHYAKQKIYDDHVWLLESLLISDSAASGMQRRSLALSRLLKRDSFVEGEEPTFKFLHFMLPHKPLMLDENCENLPKRVRTAEGAKHDMELYKRQARCALKLAIGVVDTMRELDVFDQSLIVIAADHGTGPRKQFDSVNVFFRKSVGRAMPVLLIKPPHSDEPFSVSSNPSTLTDIPKTITDLLGLESEYPGVSAFEAAFPRERHYYHYVWWYSYRKQEYLPPLQEFIIDGPVAERDSWTLGRLLTRPE